MLSSAFKQGTLVLGIIAVLKVVNKKLSTAVSFGAKHTSVPVRRDLVATDVRHNNGSRLPWLRPPR